MSKVNEMLEALSKEPEHIRYLVTMVAQNTLTIKILKADLEMLQKKEI